MNAMKMMMISIRPKYVSMILNKVKTIEVRKRFPSDYVGWVYIYATKQNDLFKSYIRMGYYTTRSNADDLEYNGKGKVVARFWCDKVDDYVYGHKWSWKSGAPMWGADNSYEKILKDACLTDEELRAYVDELSFSAIHITNLEIFDKPKEISEFYKLGFEKEYNQAVFCLKNNVRWKTEPDYVIDDYRLTRAPQSWCWIEV